MKRIIAMILMIILVSAAWAVAEARLSQVQMLYEDYDGAQATQMVNDEATLEELEQMLLRARGNPAALDGCTMNCTLLCTMPDGEVYDIAVATDGCPYITDMSTEKTYHMEDEDFTRLWEIFDLVQETMGYDAAVVMGW